MATREETRETILQVVLDALPHPIYVVDAGDYSVSLANRAAQERGVMAGSFCFQTTHRRDDPCDGEEHTCPLVEVRRTGQPVVVEHVHFDPDGEEQVVEVHGYPVFDGQGELVQMVEISIDVTLRALARQQLEHQARKLLERNEELDAFAHTVAHDLKNPLVSLVGFAELLTSHDLEPGQLESSLEAIARSGRRMVAIVEDLLLLSLVDRTEVHPEPTDVDAALGRVVAELRTPLEASGARLVVRGPLPPALGHASWVEAVWRNYLGNALKFGGEPPSVEVSGSRLDGRVRYVVQDRGRGLTEAERAALFVPSARLAATGVEGHGLGLSIVRRIMDKLGGRCGVDSEPGQGAAFWFELDAP